jgi:hypothetical protein
MTRSALSRGFLCYDLIAKDLLAKERLMIRTLFAGLAAITALSGMPSVPMAFGQEESDQRFGTVHFPTSCNEVAQRRFDRGMRPKKPKR